ncbi:pilus assembly protein PilP [Hydrogenophaga sp.]|uniref:pilus assembly protein PilP n=1 Tax=Hydrogenophaga sp. TaxID=1904254 RepID=UPI00271CC212|nr:pilus assembly protein PilP [Hydrogenophaga sp.]MDO8903246.1 pilus assembly protein PilP [Hydrogenophaga sp.]
MTPKKISGAILLTVIAALLSACSASGEDELQQWMVSERNSIRPSVTPIPEPSKFDPKAYTGESLEEPFSNSKLASILRSGQSVQLSNSSLIEPELNRRKQPLESFPLDVMSMVGSLSQQSQLVALVKVDNLLYQVRPGNYLGQNFGRVERITETEVVLREIVQDASGEWTQRPAALQLQEEASK